MKAVKISMIISVSVLIISIILLCFCPKARYLLPGAFFAGFFWLSLLFAVAQTIAAYEYTKGVKKRNRVSYSWLVEPRK